MEDWLAVVFDLDDTLYPERAYVLSGFRAVAAWAERELGVASTEAFAEFLRLYESGVRGDTFDRWLAERGLQGKGAIADLVRAYREHEPKLEPDPGISELLARLRQQGYRLGLLSDGLAAVQRRKLAALDLERHFDAVFFSDDLGRAAWKPSPRPYEILLERLGAPALKAVYVADNPAKDFLGARRAGMASVRLRREGGEYARSEPPTPEHAADLTIVSLADLEPALERLGAGGSWSGTSPGE